jgi:hypothetical protein
MTRARVLVPLLLLLAALVWADEAPLVNTDNMAQLKCAKPDTVYAFTGSNAPGQLFVPNEPVNLTFSFTKGADAGTVKDFGIEIQEITTRDPNAMSKSGFSDTAGFAPLLGLEGKPILVPITVTFDDKPKATVTLNNFPLPQRFGTYALVLVRGNKRQFLASLARVPAPRPYGTVENTPVFGEGQFMAGDIRLRAKMYARMGVRGWRSELSWNENADYTINWKQYDPLFAAAEENGQKIMVTLGGHPMWTRPFSEPTPASGWHANSGGYWGTGDWCCDPKWYNRYEHWITTFCYRYWKGGTGALWGLENYNEPWEGGGISGWARDCLQYREIQKRIANAARVVDPRIRLLAASSIMNTEDKFYSDGSNEFDKYVDIFTDHYVPPPMCYGPMVAKAHGKESMETETWFVNSEYLLPQGVAQFMASGQQRIAPWHPRVLFDNVPGGNDGTMMPAPVVTATAAFNYFVTGKTFEKLVFHNHLPWVFQFGKDDDKDALLVVFGQLMTIGGSSPKERLWAQVDGAAGGSMLIDNRDGLLQFFDLAGNPMYVGQKTVTLPMSIFPTYIKCKNGPVAAAQRLAQTRITGKRPVEIIPRDFTQRMAPGAVLNVDVHNCLTTPLIGDLTVTPPAGLTFKATKAAVQLAAGETKRVAFEITAVTPNDANAYACAFAFTSNAGTADYSEAMHATLVVKGARTIDGNLDDWKDVPGVVLIAGAEKMDPTELMRRPWLAQAEKQPDGTFGELKLAWDDTYLYIGGRVNDPTQDKMPRMEGRDENKYYHTKDDDNVEPYKSFIEAFRKKVNDPTRSFGEVPYVWRSSPEHGIPFRRDRLQIGLDVTDDWHDLTPDTDRVPAGFHVIPDTDYEYSLYLCDDGKPELWRQLAPGVARLHDFPRQPRGKKTSGPVPGAKVAVVRQGNWYLYEAAIPKSELATLNLKPGTTMGVTWKIGNSQGPSAEWGWVKAASKVNGLSLHPYWERSPDCGVKWTLVE